jgi:hypothetical protein
VAFKLWPLAVAPIVWWRGGRRAILPATMTVVAVFIVWLAVGGGISPIRYVVSFRGATGWQIESTVGSIVSLVTDEVPRVELGAIRVGVIPAWAQPILGLLTLAVLGATWWKASRDSRIDVTGFPAAAAVATTIVFAPVASAQYVAWIVPWCAIAVAERRRRGLTVATMAAACLASAAFLVYWEIAGDLTTLEWISVLRAVAVLAIPVMWLAERADGAT